MAIAESLAELQANGEEDNKTMEREESLNREDGVDPVIMRKWKEERRKLEIFLLKSLRQPERTPM